MTHYPLSIQQPDRAPPPEVAARLPQMARDLSVIVADLKGAGGWVFRRQSPPDLVDPAADA